MMGPSMWHPRRSDALLLDGAPSLATEDATDSLTVSNVVESPADPLLRWRDLGQPPSSPLPPEPRQRGIMPAGIGLLLLGLTGLAVVGLLIKQEWLLALLTLLIGGLVATHLGGVRSPGTLFGGVLLVLGLTVAMAVEIVYLADFLAGSDAFRMNTVFKFYMQVWVLLSMGSAVALYTMLGPRGRLVRRTATVAAPAPPAPAAAAGEPDSSPFAATEVAAAPASADADYRAFMPPAERDGAVADETEDPLGWLVPPPTERQPRRWWRQIRWTLPIAVFPPRRPPSKRQPRRWWRRSVDAADSGVSAVEVPSVETDPALTIDTMDAADYAVSAVEVPAVETELPADDGADAEPEPTGLDRPRRCRAVAGRRGCAGGPGYRLGR